MGKRAANGMGSIRQRPDGRWEARYTAPDGRQHSVFARTQKEVSAKLKAVLQQVDGGAWREPTKMLMSQWFEIWLTDYQTHITERTTRRYRCVVNKHFIPSVGNIRVVKLLPLHIRHMVSDMMKAGCKESTIGNYMAIFNSCLEAAVEAGLITRNPADAVKMPRVPPTQFTIVDRADIARFIELAKENPYGNEMVLLLLTGLRLGELCGLRWEDIDFAAGTMHVQRQLHQHWKDLSPITPPKYGEDRILHLAPEALALLREQRRRQAKQRLASNTWVDDDVSKDLVFRADNGAPCGYKSVYRAVKEIGAKMDLPDLHPHDLRHSYAIAALRSGADVKTVQHNLGHRTAKMTLDVYAAYTDDAGRESAAKLSAYLQNISAKPN